jgi:DNA-binding winged helix-turn-helix (wHTH) protein/tetratricopeptide (TPR) repeat protein
MKEALIRFEGYEIALAQRALRRNGKVVPLNPRTFDLLVYLARHSQKVVSKEELLSSLWPGSFVEESNLTQHIFLLRKALAIGGPSGRFIVTVPGRGYQFAAGVELENLEPIGQPKSQIVLHAVESVTRVVMHEESDGEPQLALQAPHGRHSPRWIWISAAAALVVTIAAGGWYQWRRMHRPQPPHLEAILADFENTTGDPELDRTLNEALQNDLGQSPFLDFLSRPRVQETLGEMQRSPGEMLTPAVAREICERNNAQAMIHGKISQLGEHYLLLVVADSCVSGKRLAGYNAEVPAKDDLLSVLDMGASQVRKELGESAASVERYQIPITQATTPSIDALRAYSEAGGSFWRGDMKAAQILLNRAIALDPKFASAYRALGSSYYNLGDYVQAANYYKKAFELRERTTDRERLGIEAMYYGYGLGDLEEAIRRTKQSLEIYPDTTNNWVSLANLYTLLGEYPQAIDAAEHAHQLDRYSSVATVELARSYMRASRFAESKKVASEAIARGMDHWDFHSILFQIAYAEHDAAKMKAEGDWGLTHQHVNTSLCDLGFAAASSGKLRAARDYFSRARSEALRNGETDFADEVLVDQARILTDLEEPGDAAATIRYMNGQMRSQTKGQMLAQMGGRSGDPGEVALVRTAVGDSAAARQFLQGAASAENKNTVEIDIDAPIARALLALQAHKPMDAIKELEPARAYQLRDFSIPYIRAEAETEAGMLEAAAQDYRLILANQGVDPIGPEFSLAMLKLARVLAREQQNGKARQEYELFFQQWKNADPEIPLLVAARKEYARLLASQTPDVAGAAANKGLPPG